MNENPLLNHLLKGAQAEKQMRENAASIITPEAGAGGRDLRELLQERKEEQEKCPYCQEGTVLVPAPRRMRRSKKNPRFMLAFKCEYCHGTGKRGTDEE
jgi:hypothetical protein